MEDLMIIYSKNINKEELCNNNITKNKFYIVLEKLSNIFIILKSAKPEINAIFSELKNRVLFEKELNEINNKLNYFSNLIHNDVEEELRNIVINNFTTSKEKHLKSIMIIIESKVLEIKSILKKCNNLYISLIAKQNKNKNNILAGNTKLKNRAQFKYVNKKYITNDITDNYNENNDIIQLTEQKDNTTDIKTNEINKINSTMSQIMELFGKMTSITKMHEETLMEIELESENSKKNIFKSKEILKNILFNISNDRSIIIKVFIILTVIGFIFMIYK